MAQTARVSEYYHRHQSAAVYRNGCQVHSVVKTAWVSADWGSAMLALTYYQCWQQLGLMNHPPHQTVKSVSPSFPTTTTETRQTATQHIIRYNILSREHSQSADFGQSKCGPDLKCVPECRSGLWIQMTSKI